MHWKTQTAAFHWGPFPIASLNLPRPGRWAVRLHQLKVIFAMPTLKSYFHIFPHKFSHLLLNILWEGLSQPAADACTTKKMQKLKKKSKTCWKPKMLWLQNLHKFEKTKPSQFALTWDFLFFQHLLWALYQCTRSRQMRLWSLATIQWLPKNAPTTSNFKTFQRVQV